MDRSIRHSMTTATLLAALTATSTQAQVGAPDASLVYTPVEPCRVFDTRGFGGGSLGADETRHFMVHGSGEALAIQGGAPGGCHAPEGEPVAVHINLTVVPAVAGHIRVFPKDDPLPLASALNFVAGEDSANAVTVKSLFNIADADISVYASGETHVLADVQGYYYPARLEPDWRGVQFVSTPPGRKILSTSLRRMQVLKLSQWAEVDGYMLVNVSADVAFATAGNAVACGLALNDQEEYVQKAYITSSGGGLRTTLSNVTAYEVQAGLNQVYLLCHTSGSREFATNVYQATMTSVFSPRRLDEFP